MFWYKKKSVRHRLGHRVINIHILKHIDPFCCNINTNPISNARPPEHPWQCTHTSENSTPPSSPLTQPSTTQPSDDCPTPLRTFHDSCNNLTWQDSTMTLTVRAYAVFYSLLRHLKKLVFLPLIATFIMKWSRIKQ